MLRHALTVGLALVLGATAEAQTTSSKLLSPGERGLRASEALGGDLLVAYRGGSSARGILRSAPDGSTVWNVDVNDSLLGVRGLSDGSLVAFGGSLAWIIGVDAAGQKLWGWSIQDFNVDDSEFTEVIETSDGGLAIVGSSYSSGSSYEFSEMLVFRMNADGSQRWVQRVWEDNVDTSDGDCDDVVELPNGDILATGTVGGDPLVVRMDGGTGNIIWHEQIDLPGFSWRTEVEINAGGQLFVLASPVFSPGSPALVRIDPAGLVVWARDLTTSQGGFATSLTVAADGGPVVVGRIDKNARITKFDASGNLEWDRVLAGPAVEELSRITTMSGGDLVAVGFSWPQPLAQNKPQAWVVRLDAEGRAPGCLASPPSPASVTNLDDAVAYVNTDIDSSSQGPNTISQSPTTTPVGVALLDACWPTLGTNFCSPAVLNSSGAPAEIDALGSIQIADEDFLVAARSMPADRFGYFLVGMGTGTFSPPGAQGTLCLTGSTIFRFAKNVASTGATGEYALIIDLTALPGHGAVKPGDTWNFQAWFRDANPGPTSNFSDAVAVTFQ